MSIASSAFVARPATLDDLEEVANILHRVFGVRQSAATLRWKYTGCAGRLVGTTVLTSDRRIIGFLGQIPVRVYAVGREILAVQGADVGVLEEHRRLDAFLIMLRACVGELEAAGVALAYGTANADAALTLATLLGQQRVAAVPLLVRPLDGTIPGRILSAFARTTELVTRCGASSVCAGLRLTRVNRFDDRFDRFWRRIRDDYPIMLVRDAAYLNWRYVDKAGVGYERIGIENAASGDIEGYAVLSITRRAGRVRGRVCDLITPRHGGRRAAHALIAASVKWFRVQKADAADVWMFPHAHLRYALRRHGFVRRRTGQGGFQASALATGAAAKLQGVERAANWFLSLGDSDTV